MRNEEEIRRQADKQAKYDTLVQAGIEPTEPRLQDMKPESLARRTGLLLTPVEEQTMGKQTFQALFRQWEAEDTHTCQDQFVQAGITPTEEQMAEAVQECLHKRLVTLFKRWAKEDAQVFFIRSLHDGLTPTEEQVTEAAYECFKKRYALLAGYLEEMDNTSKIEEA